MNLESEMVCSSEAQLGFGWGWGETRVRRTTFLSRKTFMVLKVIPDLTSPSTSQMHHTFPVCIISGLCSEKKVGIIPEKNPNKTSVMQIHLTRNKAVHV